MARPGVSDTNLATLQDAAEYQLPWLTSQTLQARVQL